MAKEQVDNDLLEIAKGRVAVFRNAASALDSAGLSRRHAHNVTTERAAALAATHGVSHAMQLESMHSEYSGSEDNRPSGDQTQNIHNWLDTQARVFLRDAETDK